MRNAVQNPRRAPAGFTLTELLVVVVIVLLLAAAVVPAALSLSNGRALREASSSLQSAIAGARDRATAAREARGVRLIPDANDPSVVRQLRYVGPRPPMATGSAIVLDAAWNAPWNNFTLPFPPGATTGPTLPAGNTSWPNGTAPIAGSTFSMVVLLGATLEDAKLLQSLPYRTAGTTKVYFGAIRLAAAGQPLGFTTTDALLNDPTFQYPVLRLDAPLARPIPFDYVYAGVTRPPYQGSFTVPPGMNLDDYLATVGVPYTINLGNADLPGETPIDLPAGVVIDLGYIDPTGTNPPDSSRVRLSRLTKDGNNWDIMFAPSGPVVGSAASDPEVFLWVRETNAAFEDVAVATAVVPSGFVRMIPTNNTGNHSIVVIRSRTGLVGGVEPNFGSDASIAVPTVDDPTLTAGTLYWNPNALYQIYYSQSVAPEGGETGL